MGSCFVDWSAVACLPILTPFISQQIASADASFISYLATYVTHLIACIDSTELSVNDFAGLMALMWQKDGFPS